MKKVLVGLFVILVILGTVKIGQAGKVVVVLSRSLMPYEQAWRGFEQAMNMDVSKHNMAGNADLGQKIMQSIAPDTKAVVVIGSEATMMAKKYVTQLPIVYTMVLEEVQLAVPVSGGVLMQVKIDNQLENISKLFPDRKQIGVIYNMHYSREVIQSAREITKDLGLHLVPIAVEGQSDIPMALNKITRDNVDVLWSVVDPTVAKPEAMQKLIAQTRKEKIPFVALSRYHVKAGALAAISVDYQDMGTQTATLTKTILKTGKSQSTQYPKNLILFVNEKTKKQLGIQRLPNLSGVNIVYE